MKQSSSLVFFGLLLIMGLFSVYYFHHEDTGYQKQVFKLNMNSKNYDLMAPVGRWEMPVELQEISGLSYYRAGQLACVQDEKGVLYIYDLIKKEVVRREKFGKKGDYEAVEVINDTAFVLKSNGEVYYFRIEPIGIGEVKKIKTDLKGSNDTEGLGFMAIQDELLVACKEKPGTSDFDLDHVRSVYAISKLEKKFKAKPKFLIDEQGYKNMLSQKGLEAKRHLPFKPSGVAVHPQTNFVFIISSVGSMMALLNPDGELVNLIPLNPELFVQPEGICFSPKGDLYIASEGKGKNGYILQF